MRKIVQKLFGICITVCFTVATLATTAFAAEIDNPVTHREV